MHVLLLHQLLFLAHSLWRFCIRVLICAGVSVILNATQAGFGVATGPILIDETRCVGNESQLINCRHNGIGTHNCPHSRDIGLRCLVRKLYITSNLHPSWNTEYTSSQIIHTCS